MKKNRLLVLLCCFVLCVSFLAGCGKNKTDLPESTKPDESVVTPQTISLPFDQPLDFGFSSGAGAWYTSLTLKPDGTFSGSYHNSEMGNVGEGYPLGTVYCADFSGKFTDIEKTDDYSYKMKLSEFDIENEGNEYIEDEMRYVVSVPNGMDGTEYVLYVPQTPIENLSDEFLSWRKIKDDSVNQLSVYGIENKTTGIGFFAY